MKYLVLLFALISFAPVFSQEFENLEGIDAVYFEDIKSIEFRIGQPPKSNENQWANLKDIETNINQLQKLKSQIDNKKTSDNIDHDIEVLQNQQDNIYNTTSKRDSWNAIYAYPLSQIPILNLGSNQVIQFAFDDLHPETTDFSYTVIPYTWDWSKPLDLAEGEYLEAFSTSLIDQFLFPELTTTNYTSYRFFFPNHDIKPTITGNYLLIVYETNSEEVAFTRRIYIASQDFQFVDDVRGNDFDRDSLQHINFTLAFPEQYSQLAPTRDVKVVVLQNGRYDNAIVREKPALVIHNKLRYGYQDPIGFPPGKEFRFVMIQTLNYAQVHTYSVKQGEDDNEVFLNADAERVYHPFSYYRDLDGKFVTMNGPQNKEPGDPDYAHVYFTFQKDNPYYEADLYIVGKFTDWQFQEEYKMSYNNRAGRYEGEAFLKQGYYDYYYALKHGNSEKLDIDKTEGHSFQTGNEYTILVYYIKPNGRLNKLVASRSISVNHN